jgi:hypothetical protein
LAVAWVTTGKKFSPSGWRVFSAKKPRHRVVAPAENVLRVGHRHVLDGTHQQVFAHGNRRLGRAVHAGHQLVDPLALTGHLEQLGRVFQEARQRNTHFRIAQKTVGFTEQADSRERAFLQRHFQPLAGVFVGEVGQGQGAHLLVRGQHQQGRCAGE